MVLTTYIFGVVVCFGYFLFRLSFSTFRSYLVQRTLKAFVLSLFWIVTVPYMLFTGRFLKSQKELDEELFDYYRDIGIEKFIESLREIGKDFDEEGVRERLRHSAGTLQDLINEEREKHDNKM